MAEEGFQAAACDAGERPRTHAEPPHITEQAIVYHCPDPCAEAGEQRAALLLSLSPDFDRRSQELYQIMLVAQAAHKCLFDTSRRELNPLADMSDVNQGQHSTAMTAFEDAHMRWSQ